MKTYEEGGYYARNELTRQTERLQRKRDERTRRDKGEQARDKDDYYVYYAADI